MRWLRTLLLVAFSVVAVSVSATELVLIANPNSGIERLTRDQVVDLYMGRNRKLPSGITALPIDLQTEGQTRQQFYQQLVGKDLAQINSYWARLVFSGKAMPPFQVPDSRTAIDLVATNPSALAYVERTTLDKRVKVVYELH